MKSLLLIAQEPSFELEAETTMSTGNSTAKRGFASMSPEKQREIASKGGKSVPSEKRSF